MNIEKSRTIPLTEPNFTAFAVSRRRRLCAAGQVLLCGLLVAGNVHCGLPGAVGTGDVVGLTSGGAQDIADARAQIRAGSLPDSDAITVEGFFSEHEIPLTPPENPEEIYASVALTWRKPFGANAPGAEILVRMGSTIDLDSFQRPPLNLAVVIDRSGSMNDSGTDFSEGSKLKVVQRAVRVLVDQLNAGDLLTIVSFNDRPLLELRATSADQRGKIDRVIDRLWAIGNTNMERALKLAFDHLAENADAQRASRVILFSDALPNKGATQSSEFMQLLRSNAQRGIGFTMMGVGWYHGGELARKISEVPEANSYFLDDADRVVQIFEEDFKFIVTPAVRDLVFDISIPDGVGIRDVYGVPDYIPGARGARVEIPTLFFSRREGSGLIIVRLTFAETPTFETPVTLAQASLSYTLADGTQRSAATELVLPAGLAPEGDPAYFSDSAAKRAALLLDTVLLMKDAVRAGRDGRSSDARQSIEQFLTLYDQTTLGMSDRTDPTARGLNEERELLQSLMGALR